ncbi:hypothetical protein L1887_13809 [Cichorium endivia]|nr:hypothetical protein L1887_13809 [Cichorium endivia]
MSVAVACICDMICMCFLSIAAYFISFMCIEMYFPFFLLKAAYFLYFLLIAMHFLFFWNTQRSDPTRA